jgi:hypothetical protein
MAETQTAPAIDYDKLADAVAGKLGGRLDALEQSQKQLRETFTQQPQAQSAGAGKTNNATDQQPLTAADVERLVTTNVTNAMKTLTTQMQQSAQREAFIGQHLSKLPTAYRAQLGNDPTKWETEARAIQQQYETDFKGAGGQTENKGGATNDGGQTAAAAKPDLSKMSATDKISLGLKSLPATPVVQANGAPAANQQQQTTTPGAATTAAVATV